MKCIYRIVFLLPYFTSVLSAGAHYNESIKLPLWTWECSNEKCSPSKPTEAGKLQSLETCNMLCSTMQLWPQPSGAVSMAATAVPIRSDLIRLDTILAPSRTVRQHLQDSFELFRSDLRNIEGQSRGFEEWRNLIVRISVKSNEDPRMRVDTDESYELSLRPFISSVYTLIADIEANSFCGARHGLETLSQLMWLDPYAQSLLIIQAATIKDSPKFPYRGLLLDTARNFYPFADLVRTIDAMAASKLNTFHWHISDSQAFSLSLNSVPHLAQYGGYSETLIYTPDQVRALTRRARLRGIRILIEVDTPAHVGYAWAWGPEMNLGDLVFCLDIVPWNAICSEPPCGQLNPLNPHVFKILRSIYGDIIHLTGVDDIFHLGGSDISFNCWLTYFNITSPLDLWIQYSKKALFQLSSVNNKLPNMTIFWYSKQSIHVKTKLKQYEDNIVLQIRNFEWAKNAVKGLRTILSYEDAWDLNSGLGNWYEENGGAAYNSWQKMYEHRPWARGGFRLVEGGEATAWSWALHRQSLDSRIWPRAAAVAERLWTDRPEGATRLVHSRLDVHVSRLVSRGIQPTPLWSAWCTQNTFTCG